MEITNTNLNEEDQNQFKDWLELNLNNISWEGRYINEFNEFWAHMFPSDISINDQFSKIIYAKKYVKAGPLIAWFQWLEEKLICFLFQFKGLSITNLAEISGNAESAVALILRCFLVERFPHFEEELNVKFQLTHITCENIDLKFSDLAQEFEFDQTLPGSLEDDVLKNLEVTLYEEWMNLNESFKTKTANVSDTMSDIQKSFSFKKQVKFFQELIILFVLGGALIFVVKMGNKWYEDYLVKKITLFEPSFFWLDKNLSFKSENPLEKNQIELSYKELEELEKLESKNVFEETEETTKYYGESDVVLTSIESLPKDFKVADMEQSSYEEVRKGGYRNVTYGRRNAYRVMMTSADPQLTKKELVDILKRYNVTQVDNVKPGKEIPGGVYFNVYVPRIVIKEFLSNVSNVEESTILESKTVFAGPADTNKVFIWIKSI